MNWQQSKDSRRAAYGEKLKDPRWQKMRLLVLERDGWACTCCGDNEKTLHVHHSYYDFGSEPWDYPTQSLITLCDTCHDNETLNRSAAENYLLRALKECKFDYINVQQLGRAMKEIVAHSEIDIGDNGHLEYITAVLLMIARQVGDKDAVQRFIDSEYRRGNTSDIPASNTTDLPGSIN